MAKTLEDLLIDSLRDAYSAEQQLMTALPELTRATEDAALGELFASWEKSTQIQIGRICQALESLGEVPEGRVSAPMEALLHESQKVAQDGLAPELMDAALIAAAHKIAHYEIAAYGAICGYAEACGHKNIAKALRVTAAEETDFDDELSRLAKSSVNPRAKAAAASS